MTAPQTTSASYEVGYRKPPRHTQFQKGQSGNPGGRPRRLAAERLEELALYEAYRTTIVMEDGHATPMSAIQAVLRSQLQSAASGNVRAQRDVLAMIRDIELVRSVTARFDNGGTDDAVDDDDDADDDDNDADDSADNNDVDDVDAIDGDDSEVDDAADANRDDAGSTDDDEPVRQQVDGIATYGERRQDMGAGLRLNSATDSSPPPCGEGSGVGVEPDGIAVPLGTTPHPNPPPAETAYTRVSATELSDRNRQQPISIGGRESTRPNLTPKRRGVRSRRNGPVLSAGAESARPQPGRRHRSPAVNDGKIREGRPGRSRRSPGRANAGPGPAQAAGGHARATAAPGERDEKLKIRC
jgi:Family of unknown function (DUF5681)